MKLTPEQQAVLDGSKGAVMAKVMKTLVMYGERLRRGKHGARHAHLRPHCHQLRQQRHEAGL